MADWMNEWSNECRVNEWCAVQSFTYFDCIWFFFIYLIWMVLVHDERRNGVFACLRARANYWAIWISAFVRAQRSTWRKAGKHQGIFPHIIPHRIDIRSSHAVSLSCWHALRQYQHNVLQQTIKSDNLFGTRLNCCSSWFDHIEFYQFDIWNCSICKGSCIV